MSPRTFRIAVAATCLAASLPLAAAPQGSVELLNQVTVLRGEVQALRAEIEELQRQQQQQADSARSQYLDLDSRLGRLEGGGPLPADAALEVATAPAPALTPPAAATTVEARVAERAIPAASGNEEQDYLAAFDALKQGDYVDAARAFQSFLARHPDGFYAPNALYWLGESYYVTQNYAMAERQFQTVIDRFPNHDKAAGALLKVGLSQYGQDAFEAAAGTLGEVVARYPGTDVARTAEDSLRSMRLDGI